MKLNKNKKPKSTTFLTRNSRFIIMAIFLVSLFLSALLGSFNTKAVGTNQSSLWYNHLTGHYNINVFALTYAGFGGDKDGDYDVGLGSEIICTFFYKDTANAVNICDDDEPYELYSVNPAVGNFGVDGTDNIDAIVFYANWDPSLQTTVLIPHTNAGALIAAFSPPAPYTIVDTFPSIFLEQGEGNDYLPNFSILTSLGGGTVTLYGGDGVGGTRDDTPPGAINDLSATGGSDSGKIDISLTETGDDGNVGTAYSYILKYSTSIINAGNFDSATTYSQTWEPDVSGHQVTNATITGFSPGNMYYLSIKACDKYNNCGAFGNTISAVASFVSPAYISPDVLNTTPKPSLLINDGLSSTTNNRLVKLTIKNPGEYSSKMRVSNFSDFRDSSTNPLDDFSSEIASWDLCKNLAVCDNGTKMVYIDLYDLNRQSSGSFSSSVELSFPTTISINSGALSTSSRNVMVSIASSNEGIKFFKISNLADLSDTGFQYFYPTSPTVNGWDLCSGSLTCPNGERTVYVQLYDSMQEPISNILSAKISLNIPVEEEKKDEEPKEEEVVLPITENIPPVQQPPTVPEPTPANPEPEPEPEPALPTPEPEPEPTPIPTPAEPERLKVIIQKIDEIVANVGTPIESVVLVATAVLSFVAVTNSFVDLLAILRYLITLLLQFLGIKRKNKNWGIVYDSNTKEPLSLCIVRLFDAKTGTLSQTAVTDMKGRFGLLPVSGKYYVTVTKPIFSFPSRFLRGIRYDIGYSSLYFGGNKFLSGKNIINFAIPLDKFSLKKKSTRTLVVIRSFLVSLSTPVAILGALLSLIILIINPTIINFIVLMFYVLLLLLKKLFLSPPKKPSVRIMDYKKRRPISGLAIEVFSKKYEKLVTTKVSDKKGEFDLFLPDGEYFFKTSFGTYKFVNKKEFKNSYNGGTLIVGDSNPFKGINIYLRKI